MCRLFCIKSISFPYFFLSFFSNERQKTFIRYNFQKLQYLYVLNSFLVYGFKIDLNMAFHSHDYYWIFFCIDGKGNVVKFIESIDLILRIFLSIVVLYYLTSMETKSSDQGSSIRVSAEHVLIYLLYGWGWMNAPFF